MDTPLPQHKPRLHRPVPFAEILPKALSPALKANGFWPQEMVLDWPKIVGEVFGAHSVPRKLTFPKEQRTGGCLLIATTGATALLMQHQVMPILDRINTYFGYAAVASLKFQQVDLVYLQSLSQDGCKSAV